MNKKQLVSGIAIILLLLLVTTVNAGILSDVSDFLFGTGEEALGENNEPTITYGNGWKEVHYSDGRVIHTDGIKTFRGWDGVWQSWSEWNISYSNVSGNLIADGGNFKSIFYQHKNTIVTGKFRFSQQPSALRFLNIETKAHTKILDASAASQITMQNNKLTYEDIYPNVDYEFTYNGVKLKEDIVSHRTNYPNSPYPLDKTYLVFSTKLWEFSGIHKLIDDDGEIMGNKDVKGVLKLKNVNEDVLSYLPIGRAYSTFQINESYNETRSTKVHNRLIKVSGTWYLFSGINYTWVKDVNRMGDITIDPTWVVGSGGDAWSGNVSHDGTTEVQSTGNVELRHEVDDYISYWRFDKGTGNTAYDENETSNNDGGFTDGSTGNWTSSSKYGDSALDFDGDNDYINCGGNSASLNTTRDAITISAWVKRRATGNNENPIERYGSAENRHWILQFKDTDVIRFQIYETDSTYKYAQTSTTYTNLDIWYHIICVWGKNEDSGKLKIFVNGQETTYSTQQSQTTSIQSGITQSLKIGGVINGYLNGTIDEVGIYKRVLSNNEINQTMNNEHHTSGNLISWHDADPGNETYKLSVNFTFPANTNASINLYNNDTGAFIETLATNNNTEQWSKTITSAVQDSKVNITLYGNVSQTPEVHNITYHTQAAGEYCTAPAISNVINGSISPTSQWIDWDVNQTAYNRVKYSNESDMTPSWWSSWENSTNAPNITISGLDASTQYWFSAYSYNTTNTSLYTNSSIYNFTTVAIDTTFTVTLPIGYAYVHFQPPNSTAKNYSCNGQNLTTAFYNVTNTGNVDLDVRMKLNATVTDIILRADTDNNPSGSSIIQTSLVTLYSGLIPANSIDIWLWSDFNHPIEQSTNRTLDINVTQ